MRRRLRRRLLRFGTQLIKGRVQWGEGENKIRNLNGAVLSEEVS